MSARASPRNSRGSCVSEAFINGINLVLGCSPSPRSSRLSPSSLGPTTTTHPSPILPAGHAISISNTGAPPACRNQPGTYHSSHSQGGTVPSAGLSQSGVPAANSTAPISFPSGSNTAGPRSCSLAVWVMTTLEKGASAIYPLHSIARTILDGCEIFEVAHTNAEAYETLANELNAMAATLKNYVPSLGSEPASGDIAQMEESIQRCSSHVNQQRVRNTRRQMFESGRDQGDVANSRHKVECIYRGVQAITNGAILRRTKNQLEDGWLRVLGHVEDARFNSDFAPQIRRHGCTPGTRIGVHAIANIWACDPKAPKYLWIYGGPGTGKTTIAYTVCEELQQRQLLGASYFCSKTSLLCGSLRRLIPTIAYQLANCLPIFRSALCKILEEHRDCSSLEPRWQLYWLLSKPLEDIKGQMSKDLVVVIDGIDECEDNYFLQLILEQLLGISVELPIKILITSRSEPTICNSMSAAAPDVIDLQDLDPLVVRADVKNYLTESLKDMSPPPTVGDIERLAGLSENLFMYAATVVQYILPPNMEGNPTDRLQTVLKIDTPIRVCEPLDALYSTLLQRALSNLNEKELKNLQLVLWTIICAKEPMTVKTTARLVDIEEANVTTLLRSLHSVLHVQGGSRYVTVHHTSFYDFIRGSSQSGQLHCDDRLHNSFLARRCFQIMELQLKFNICNLESSFIADSDISDLKNKVEESISVELTSTCRYWAHHLRLAPFSEELHSMLSKFLSTQLLQWVEVLNLQGCIGEGAAMLLSARSWLPGDDFVATKQELVDARNFVTRFASNGCSISTAHIYTSGLPSCPRTSSVHRNFWPFVARLRNITGLTMNHTQDAALARWPTEAQVTSLACSSDGASIASGYCNGSIQLWNIHTGTMIGSSIKGCGGSICSLRFSRDNTRLASGSYDRSICLYDITTAHPNIIQWLTRHEGPVCALDFSFDGTRIVSGSDDGTVQLWNAESGDLIDEPLIGELEIHSIAFSSDDSRVIAMGARTVVVGDIGTFDAIIQSWNLLAPGRPTSIQSFSGHEGRVLSVDLSPDGICVATGGSDHTIRLWRTDTETQIGQSFTGHTGGVLAVKFLSDGTRIVSGSTDKTLRIWDVSTGSSIGHPFKGHSSAVGMIVPVPGDTRLISASDDATIRIWDIDTPIPANSLVSRRPEPVCSVTFSPDGELILSGSEDKGVRVWNARTGELIDMPVEHTDSILSVACSPDKRYYAASSRDGTVLVGDILPGPRFGKPIVRTGHQSSVMSIAFSVDGSRLVTSSSDQTIKTWDSRTLEAIGPQFKKSKGYVTDIALVHRDNNTYLVASGSDSEDKTVRLLDLGLDDATQVVLEMKGHNSAVLSVACSPKGDLIVSGSYDSTIRIWNGHTGKEMIKPIKGHTKAVRSVALFESNGTRIIASGSDDTTVQLWEADTGARLGLPLRGHTSPVLSVGFSPDGRYIVSGSADGSIRLWDVKSRWPPKINEPDMEGTAGSQLSTSAQISQSPNVNEAGPWTLRDDGWIVDNGRLVFWVLSDQHPDSNQMLELSSHPGSVITYLDSWDGVKALDLAIGEDWMTCFGPG